MAAGLADRVRQATGHASAPAQHRQRGVQDGASRPATGSTRTRAWSSTRGRSMSSSPQPTLTGWRPAPTSATCPDRATTSGCSPRRPTSRRRAATNGILQYYGVYLPSDYDPHRATPTQYWFHFRGGSGNVAAAVVPGVIWDMGEHEDSIVVTPDGRGQQGWYVGQSQKDILQVWADSHRLFPIDPNRTYIAGHSMGGWASYLLPIEHPDWFAAAFPASGAVTQGAYTAAPGCSANTPDSNGACWIDANGGNAQDEYTEPLLDNLEWVPYVHLPGHQRRARPDHRCDRERRAPPAARLPLPLLPVPRPGALRPPDRRSVDRRRRLRASVRPQPQPARVHLRPQHGVRARHRDRELERRAPQLPAGPRVLDVGARARSTRSRAWRDSRGARWRSPTSPHTLVPETGPPATANQNYPYAMVGQAWSPDMIALRLRPATGLRSR